ncbi:hypothetical protein FRC03_007246, partial [Tulasnella sp. 419]
MRSFTAIISLALLIAPVFGAPANLQVIKTTGAKDEGSYIVKLKDSVNKKLTLAWLKSHLGPDSFVTHDYEGSYFNAFSGRFNAETLQALAGNKDVEYISEDAIFTTFCENDTHPDPEPPTNPTTTT